MVKLILDARPAMKRTPECAKCNAQPQPPKDHARTEFKTGGTCGVDESKTGSITEWASTTWDYMQRPALMVRRMRLLCDLCRVRVARVIAEAVG